MFQPMAVAAVRSDADCRSVIKPKTGSCGDAKKSCAAFLMSPVLHEVDEGGPPTDDRWTDVMLLGAVSLSLVHAASASDTPSGRSATDNRRITASLELKGLIDGEQGGAVPKNNTNQLLTRGTSFLLAPSDATDWAGM